MTPSSKLKCVVGNLKDTLRIIVMVGIDWKALIGSSGMTGVPTARHCLNTWQRKYIIFYGGVGNCKHFRLLYSPY